MKSADSSSKDEINCSLLPNSLEEELLGFVNNFFCHHKSLAQAGFGNCVPSSPCSTVCVEVMPLLFCQSWVVVLLDFFNEPAVR